MATPYQGRITFEECKEEGIHLTQCDSDGYCNHCGHQEPTDYETCGDCGYDHDYEAEQARAWHMSHPCSYCEYDAATGQHEGTCTTLAVEVIQAPPDSGKVVKRSPRHQCAGCVRSILLRYRYCKGCAKTKG